MEDYEIIDLFFARRETAIQETENAGYELAIEELSECIPAAPSVEQKILGQELNEIIHTFLSGLPTEKRKLFLRRYWLLSPVKEIAREMHLSGKAVSMRLKRIREELAAYLEKEGYSEIGGV